MFYAIEKVVKPIIPNIWRLLVDVKTKVSEKDTKKPQDNKDSQKKEKSKK